MEDIKVPSEKEQMEAGQVTAARRQGSKTFGGKIQMLQWKISKHDGQQDDGPESSTRKIRGCTRVPKYYGPLVKLEADEDKKMKEAQTQANVSINWEKSISSKYIARFHFKDIYGHISTDFRLGKGDELRVKLSAVCSGTGKPWEGTGYVIGIRDDGEVSMELSRGSL